MKFRPSWRTVCVFLTGALFASAAAAQSAHATHVWTRATAPGQTTAGVYLELRSVSNATLVSATSPAAGRAELHSTTFDGGVMRMRPLASIDLPAGQTVKLSPNSMHLMLIDLKKPLKAGDRVPLVLSVQTSGALLATLTIEAEVRSLDGSKPHRH